ncbi:RibD family protein [Aquincola sp. S2]|uniref:RibD family protein n=1 Tax=Pseudaquabacterium terrae TaxID=2732868 RepID=A0ABX2EA45_9BURK|nr:RibD family protein [Aquabacterium terrae]NRF65373.1 RibD family protein [Aquabacterium terrae]
MFEDLWPCLVAIARWRGPGTPSLPAGSVRHDAAAGWQLGDGPWDDAAREQWALFKPLLDARAEGPPWVIAQLGQSLDGCIATRCGDSAFVSGPEVLCHLHRLRALCDAVIVGAGTVAIDNPRLTTRHAAGPNPLRVLFDPRLGLAGCVASAHVFTDTDVPTLWLCDARWQARAAALAGAARVLAVPGLLRDDGTPDAAAALAALQARGCRRVLVEGGGVTVSRFLAQRRLDRLHLSIAPVLIGDGRRGLSFAGSERLADCARPRCRVFNVGSDRLWDVDLRS